MFLHAAKSCGGGGRLPRSLLQLLRKAHTFRGESSFSTWLHRLTTNCVLMEMRRKRRRSVEVNFRETSAGRGENSSIGEDLLDTVPAPPISLLEQVTLRAALAQLPIGYQRIFELHDIEGHTHEEIAELLGIRDGTSKSQYTRRGSDTWTPAEGRTTGKEPTAALCQCAVASVAFRNILPMRRMASSCSAGL